MENLSDELKEYLCSPEIRKMQTVINKNIFLWGTAAWDIETKTVGVDIEDLKQKINDTSTTE